jgi:hypothetical protein
LQATKKKFRQNLNEDGGCFHIAKAHVNSKYRDAIVRHEYPEGPMDKSIDVSFRLQ